MLVLIPFICDHVHAFPFKGGLIFVPSSGLLFYFGHWFVFTV